jgi:uncharacterized membrane protein YfcA
LELVVASMDIVLVCLIAAGLSGGFVNGLAGFGTSLFALGWLLQVMPPREAVAIALANSIATGVPGMWQVRDSINLRRLAVFLVPALVGIPLGLVALDLINTRLLSLLVGTMLLVYGGYFAFRRNLPSIVGRWLALEAGIGFLGGILGAMAGLSGALPSMWLAMRPLPKAEQRGILQPFNMVILTLATVLLAMDGGYGGPVLYNLVLTLPAGAIGAGLGLWLFRKMSDHGYRRLLILLMLFSGLSLLFRTLVA